MSKSLPTDFDVHRKLYTTIEGLEEFSESLSDNPKLQQIAVSKIYTYACFYITSFFWHSSYNPK